MTSVSAEAGGATARGQWMALAAALLGWMFDGLEMGLFPLVARPALQDLVGPGHEETISLWFSVATAGFLVGAATGGVVFGWLGDRVGRVRAMMLSILTYAIFTGLCGVAASAWQIAVFRFVSALGMGGEWSLGVALVMEVWPDRSRAFLAGLIGAAANVGYLLIGVVGLALVSMLAETRGWLLGIGLPERWVEALVANSGWRLLMMLGAAPALLTFFIRIFVPESERWRREQALGRTSHWAARDLVGVCVGAAAACAMIYLWAAKHDPAVRLLGSVAALAVATVGYTYPLVRYLQRSGATAGDAVHGLRPTVKRMLLGACLGGVALLGTWGSVQWIPLWADQLTGGTHPEAKAYAQIWSGAGAICGTMAGALLASWLGRRIAYSLLCVGSLASAMALFQLNAEFGKPFLVSVFFTGALTASFYGWLPLYLPELFQTSVRAIGQGFSFNFGRILAAIGVLQMGNLVGQFGGSYPRAGSVTSLIYVVGLAIIWLAPETKGKALPD